MTTTLTLPLPHGPDPRARATGIGLWVLIGVGTSLFCLFLVAYAMRMDGSGDWVPIGMPWQLWLSTSLLAAASVALQGAARAARLHRVAATRGWLAAGGACALAFLGVQWWAWTALLAAQVLLSGNPAGSFFYLLTALHAAHVLGGLAGWAVTALAVRDDARFGHEAWRVPLCARYWHFLLAVWVVLFAALGWLTPEIVAAICGRA